MTQQVGEYVWNLVIKRKKGSEVSYLLLGYISGQETQIAKVFTKMTNQIKWQAELGNLRSFRHAIQSLKDSGFENQADEITKIMNGGYTGEIVYLNWDFLPDFI